MDREGAGPLVGSAPSRVPDGCMAACERMRPRSRCRPTLPDGLLPRPLTCTHLFRHFTSRVATPERLHRKMHPGARLTAGRRVALFPRAPLRGRSPPPPPILFGRGASSTPGTVRTQMHRRNFLAAALSGVGGLSLAACADDSTGLLAPGDEAQRDIDSTGCYLRRNIYCLNTTSYDVVAYRDGITTMKTRAANNPTSWLAQANIHGSSAPPAFMLANLCQHGNYFFLSWHRMYLYYFERIVRSASGKPNFAL